MSSLTDTPLDPWLAARWSRVDRTHKLAFLVAVCVSVLAFGFEMTNLTLHHEGVYGVLVAHFRGARCAPDVALVASVVCVFPYMAHVYQYNSVTQTTFYSPHPSQNLGKDHTRRASGALGERTPLVRWSASPVKGGAAKSDLLMKLRALAR